jgi:predicted RNA-binding protein
MSKTLEEKQNYAKQYIRSLKAIEDEMEVYKEQKRDLRDEYREQGWLTTHELAATVRAYRIVCQANKGKLDLDELFENIEMFSGLTRGESEL